MGNSSGEFPRPTWGGATAHENAVPSRDREGAVEAITHPSLTVGAQISVIFVRAAHAAYGTTKDENAEVVPSWEKNHLLVSTLQQFSRQDGHPI